MLFYEAAFDARVLADAPDPTILLGEQSLIFGQSAASEPELARSNATSFQHCAIIVSNMDFAYTKLKSVPGWTPISRDGPEHLPESSGGVIAFKFRDPDGHPLELLQFPVKGVPPAWQGKTGVFLGIDHTAITVAETARSVVFYQELGFKVRQRGENRGAEQARMDDVDEPLVEVTGLAPPGGAPPHLELLCYVAPKTFEAPVGADDVLATRMVFVDPEVGPHPSPTVHRDPDGHRFER